jgi:hypothetical protein
MQIKRHVIALSCSSDESTLSVASELPGSLLASPWAHSDFPWAQLPGTIFFQINSGVDSWKEGGCKGPKRHGERAAGTGDG